MDGYIDIICNCEEIIRCMNLIVCLMLSVVLFCFGLIWSRLVIYYIY